MGNQLEVHILTTLNWMETKVGTRREIFVRMIGERKKWQPERT